MTTPLDITDFVYNTGTLTIAAGDTIAVFSGTSLSTSVKDGDYLFAGGSLAVIQTVTDDTHAALFTAWAGAGVSAGPYLILKASLLRYHTALIGYDSASFLAMLDGTAVWYAVEGDEPDPSIGEDGNRALKSNVTPWVVWLKTGGVWVLQAGSPGGPGEAGATWIAQDSEPSTDYPSGSLWLDSDSTDLDVYVLGGSPFEWTDTGINLKGAAGPTGAGVPTGGTTGQVLAKASDTDDDAEWIDPPASLPTGGTTGQVLTKASSTDGDADWEDPSGDVAGDTHAATGKTTPVDADEFALVDSAASNVLKKLTWANLKAALASTFLTWAPVRERLTANRTYYVATAANGGSDTNPGTSGSPFLTIQKAINTVAALDLSVYNVTIQVGAGTYTGAVLVNGPWTGLGSVSLIGDTTTPTNVVISTTSADCITSQNNGVLNVGGFKLTTTTSGSCLTATANGTIYMTGAMNFGSTPTNSPQISAANGGKIFNIGGGNITISGGSFAHVYAQQLGGIVYASIAVTVTGTPAFSYAFAAASNVGFVRSAGVTYSGSATGARYNASTNSVIQTDGAGTSALPGNAAGTTATGGQYA